MSADWDQDGVVRSWLRMEEEASADRILDTVFERVETTPQSRSGLIDRLPSVNLSMGVVLATAVAVVMAVVAIASLPGGGFLGGPPPSGGPTATPAPTGPAEPAAVVGIPPEGTPPSVTTPAELVLWFEGNVTRPGTTLWVYDDGQLITSRFGRFPEEPAGGFIGLTHQRLSADGLAFLRSQALSTGLFERDLFLAREGSAPFLQIEVRSGDDMVGVTWAWRGTTGDAPTATAPVATDEQERALRDLNALFSDPASWQESVWEDQAMEAYVPSRYAVCLGVKPPNAGAGEWAGTMDPKPIWALLPESAQELLRAAEQVPGGDMHADAGCSGLTTDDARALARILEEAGIHHEEEGDGLYWLAYWIEDPATGRTILMQFGPVLPDGTPTFLGPG
jgi:hypothetical protein